LPEFCGAYIYLKYFQPKSAGRQAETYEMETINIPGNQWNQQMIIDLLNRMKNTVMLTDGSRKIYWVNASFEELSGYRLSEITGKAPHEFLFDPYACEASTESSSVQLKCLHKNGTVFWLRVEISPILDAAGEVLGYTAIGNDITALIQYQEQLKLQHQTLKDVAFTSSHIIRAPLANILSLTPMLREEPANETLLNYLEESAQKLDETIQQLITRIGS